ncbi:MAG: glycosyl hydrolase family 25 [Bacteroidaceae bacterium]|nr:glycosyl hydrolase family 25 [Bacteroidaceae bacterium]
MQRYYLILLLLIATLSAAPSSLVAKDKKKEHVTHDFAPDPLPTSSKARPDTHGPRLRQPRAFGMTLTTDKEGGVQGIDVSHYQGDINWKEVAKTGIPKFVYVKATEGKSLVDERYHDYFAQAKRHGFKVGSYHFFRPGVDVETQYRLFIGNIDVKSQDLLPLIDVEIISGAASVEMFQRTLLTFCRLVAHAFNGQKPVIYTGKNFYDKYIASNNQLRQYQFMIAAYQDQQPQLANGDDYLIWQYTGKGRVGGIKGNVDRSRFVGVHSLSEILVNQKRIPK